MAVLLPFFYAALFSFLFTRLLIRLEQAGRWLLSPPTRDRWHKVATPSLGGIAMFASYTVTLFAFREWRPIAPLFLGGAVVFAMGLMDDLRSLPPYAKLAVQIAAACFMVVLGIRSVISDNPLIYTPITIAWFVGITNAFNLIDNMDGLSGGIALIAAIFLAALSVGSAAPILSLPGIALFAGSIFGFLIFNVPPARIFMGDCGAQWLGFMLAGLTLMDSWKTASNVFLMLATPALVLAVPIFDTLLVALNRKIHGRPISVGGRDHSSHRLVALGLSERKTVLILWGVAAVFGLIALFAQIYRMETWALLVCGGLVCILAFGVVLADARVYDSAPKNPLPRVLPIPLLYKRRIVDILSDTVLIGGSYALAYLLRFDWHLSSYNLDRLAKTLPLVIGAKLLAFLLFGIYRGLWTYIDFQAFGKLVRGSLFASITSVLAIVAAYRFEGFSRTLFVIDFFILLAGMAASRGLARALRESVFAFPESGLRILVVGAGAASQFLLREIRSNRHWGLRPLAIIDDDPAKRGQKLYGIPIVGGRTRIRETVEEKEIDRIVIAIASATDRQMEEITAICEDTGIPVITMPSLEETIVRRIVGPDQPIQAPYSGTT